MNERTPDSLPIYEPSVDDLLPPRPETMGEFNDCVELLAPYGTSRRAVERDYPLSGDMFKLKVYAVESFDAKGNPGGAPQMGMGIRVGDESLWEFRGSSLTTESETGRWARDVVDEAIAGIRDEAERRWVEGLWERLGSQREADGDRSGFGQAVTDMLDAYPHELSESKGTGIGGVRVGGRRVLQGYRSTGNETYRAGQGRDGYSLAIDLIGLDNQLYRYREMFDGRRELSILGIGHVNVVAGGVERDDGMVRFEPGADTALSDAIHAANRSMSADVARSKGLYDVTEGKLRQFTDALYSVVAAADPDSPIRSRLL